MQWFFVVSIMTEYFEVTEPMSFSDPDLRTFCRSLHTSAAFIREWMRSPRTMGMVCPSGASLAQAMAAGIPPGLNGLVVELGAGTGTVTQQLLRAGIDPCHLLVIEKAPGMAQLLQQRFPQLNIVQGDATRLCELLPPARRADCIISSLPLISLGKTVRDAIILAMYESLREGGILVQYTYSWSSSNPSLMNKFQLMDSRLIWDNVPPARVFRFMRKGSDS